MMPSHLFISEEGVISPTWQKVFKEGAVISSAETNNKKDIDIVWFKLSLQKEFKPQLDWVLSHYGEYKIVVLSNIPRFDEALQCLTQGARAYVNTHAGPNTLQQIADVVYEGGIWLGADLMQLLIARAQVPASSNTNEADTLDLSWQEKLTKREIDVAKLISQGASNKLVARELDITERTVKAHVTAIFSKLEVSDRLKLAILLNTKKMS